MAGHSLAPGQPIVAAIPLRQSGRCYDPDGWEQVNAFYVEHARAGSLVAGIGQDRQLLQIRAGLRQDELAGRGQVVGAAGNTPDTHSGTPPGAASACTFPAGSWALPEYHLSISLPFLLVFLSAHRSEEMRVPSRIR